MFGLGGGEILLILVIALIVLGPNKLPELAKTLGKGMREFRRASNDFQRQINDEVDVAAKDPSRKGSSRKDPLSKNTSWKDRKAPSRSPAGVSLEKDPDEGDDSAEPEVKVAPAEGIVPRSPARSDAPASTRSEADETAEKSPGKTEPVRG